MLVKSFGRILALSAVVLVALAGCGNYPKTAVVRGTVTYKGKPVPNGTITFIPTDDRPSATGDIGPDGSYRLTTYRPGDGAVLGTHKVVIVAMQDMRHQPAEAWTPTPPPIIPLKYTSLATTDLEAEVKDEENVINFDLKDAKK
jgi:hypothetical protein